MDLKLLNVCVSHPEPRGVENFGVLGEVHVQAAIVAERHGHFLQRLVPAVRAEHFAHVARRSDGRSTKRVCASAVTQNFF